MTFKKQQQGFTIVELLIVIVVIGILAALVITTFTGIQQKARNTERETDIKAIHGQLEAYYAQKGFYPVLSEIAGLPGLDGDALTAPNGNTAIDAAAATETKYQYATTPGDCDNTDDNLCTSYVLTAGLEGSDTPLTKASLN